MTKLKIYETVKFRALGITIKSVTNVNTIIIPDGEKIKVFDRNGVKIELEIDKDG